MIKRSLKSKGSELHWQFFERTFIFATIYLEQWEQLLVLEHFNKIGVSIQRQQKVRNYA